ncbi:16S rRNA (adenine(1518)-N(6)/adenine(1519)-N(6))-dimethyltransferase RsmA [Eggerthellaceae bacterium zg-1084]|uniref:16S rRNA (adenine(1518)-N(6)/adenine(1519)-N(6))- dimethyltransferase RsmA n=1 Tax=Berryella wangjianweii TaxID=2734634 RepID=UPI00155674FE|nr:16S rRNA (adenine(1518)-N(6)/adenine(1519)-N(6))-dimethyltransferase RsmA [Berryella wangjianweii]NPD30661.1 16S rRNA (adenine(1518)-N(6)/adenine(1519)-N(6))-dimethyltransferase RsmA [Berryella wangjianweii]
MDRLSPLAGVAATRKVLQAHGLHTKHALGQNFLVNDDVLRKIVQLAQVSEGDYVLEVGPGIGTLTYALLGCGARVTSIERDRDLPAVLADTLAPFAERFELVQKDALDFAEADLTRWSDQPPGKLVANLPYAVAATIVLGYLQRFPWLQQATVMVQREVADRMLAGPGSKSYGAYSVKLSLYARGAGRFPVAPGNFFPPPHVESAVLRLDRHAPADVDGRPLSDELRRAACLMADAAFTNRRKTLANSCRAYLRAQGGQLASVADRLSELFDAAGIDPTRRGETLDQAEFIALGRALSGFGPLRGE